MRGAGFARFGFEAQAGGGDGSMSALTSNRDVSTRSPAPARGATLRAFALGLVVSAVVALWLHWAELIISAKGHTALAGTSIPVGAFTALSTLIVVNALLLKWSGRFAFSKIELLQVYIMTTSSTIVSSSGGLHFLVPTLMASRHYANSANNWSGLFFRYIPQWIAPTDPAVVQAFYSGSVFAPLTAWIGSVLIWVGYMAALGAVTVGLMYLIHRQWTEHEKLSFPTVQLPLAMIENPGSLGRNRLFWAGFAAPFLLTILNTIHLSIPAVPQLSLRELGVPLVSPPWSSIGQLNLKMYFFVIGIGFLVSTNVAFSVWFFYLGDLALTIMGASYGVQTRTGAQSAFPFTGHQGAGAFITITLVSLWAARRHIGRMWSEAFGRRASDGMWATRLAWIGVIGGTACLVLFANAIGMRIGIAMALIVVSFCYFLAATRIRAETGSAWLFGPDTDPYRLMTTTFGTAGFTGGDLTAFAYLRPTIANFDLRCIAMPHVLDGLKMAESIRGSKKAAAAAMWIAIVLGFAASFVIALLIWYTYGAEAKTDAWRTSMGKMPFDALADALKNPVKADIPGSLALFFGGVFTFALIALRSRFPWFPFHPAGYAVAHTSSGYQVWFSMLLAWVCKSLILRYGGMRLYRAALPFFFGMIVGDLLGGGLTTLFACMVGVGSYPTNW